MRTSSRITSRGTRRQGFTIVEVIIALMIVTIGLLGIAGATALAFRTAADATRRRAAADRVQSRLALLAASGCARASSGTLSDVARHTVERWTVHTDGAFQQATDSITWTEASGDHTLAITTASPC